MDVEWKCYVRKTCVSATRAQTKYEYMEPEPKREKPREREEENSSKAKIMSQTARGHETDKNKKKVQGKHACENHRQSPRGPASASR